MLEAGGNADQVLAMRFGRSAIVRQKGIGYKTIMARSPLSCLLDPASEGEVQVPADGSGFLPGSMLLDLRGNGMDDISRFRDALLIDPGPRAITHFARRPPRPDGYARGKMLRTTRAHFRKRTIAAGRVDRALWGGEQIGIVQ